MAQGLDPKTADLLATQALRGAGAMLGVTANPGAQRQAVISPGGAPAAALRTLAAGGFDRLAAAAVAAAIARSAELAALSGQPGNREGPE